MFCPSSITEPLSAVYTPEITLKIVVLPAPFGPIIPTISPLSTPKFKSHIACTPPKLFHTFITSKSIWYPPFP